MRHLLFLLMTASLICPNAIYAFKFQSAAGARSTALGSQAAAISDVFSANNNQAGMGFIKDMAFAISAGNSFTLKELNTIHAVGVFPTKTGVFGFTVNYSGLQAYNEKKIGVSFAKSFGEKFSAGLQFDYMNLFIEEIGNKHLFTFEAGLQYYLLPQLLLGAHVNNPIRLTIDEETDEKLPTIMRFGLNYMPSKKIALLFEVEKDLDFKPMFKFGIDYRVVDKLSLRGGFNAAPFTGSFGIAAHLKSIEIAVAANIHPVLGVSPNLSLVYVLKKKSKE